LSGTVAIAIGSALLITLLIVDFLLYRLMVRSLFGLVDLFPPYRPGGRYRSQSTPEKYAALRKPRNGG
jgi:hypothetical protein